MALAVCVRDKEGGGGGREGEREPGREGGRERERERDSTGEVCATVERGREMY